MWNGGMIGKGGREVGGGGGGGGKRQRGRERERVGGWGGGGGKGGGVGEGREVGEKIIRRSHKYSSLFNALFLYN